MKEVNGTQLLVFPLDLSNKCVCLYVCVCVFDQKIVMSLIPHNI